MSDFFESVLLSELKEDNGNCDRLLQSCSTNGFLVMEWGLCNLLELTWESSSDGGVNSILLTVNKSSDNSMWNLLDWLIDFWCLTPLPTIFELYHGDQF